MDASGARPELLDSPVVVKRVYDPAGPEDGARVLVTRYWPRGVRRDAVDEWVRELGTPTDLLREYQHGRLGYEDFARQYRAWLDASPEAGAAIERLAARALLGRITLLTSFADLRRSHAPVLRRAVAGRAIRLLAQRTLERCARFVAVHVFSPDGAAPIVAGLGAPSEEIPPIAAAIAASGRELEVADAEAEGRTLDCYAGSYSLYGAPVPAGGGTPGAVVAESEEIGAFSAAERAAIQHLARRAAPFMACLQSTP